MAELNRETPSLLEQALDAAEEAEPSDLYDLLEPLYGDYVLHAEWIGIAAKPTLYVNVRNWEDEDAKASIVELAERCGWEKLGETPERDRLTFHRTRAPAEGVCEWCDEEKQVTTTGLNDQHEFLTCVNTRCPREA